MLTNEIHRMIHYYIIRKKKKQGQEGIIHEIYEMRIVAGDYFLANRSSLVRKQQDLSSE